MVHQVMDTLLHNGAVQSSQIPSPTCGTMIYAISSLPPNCWAWANSLIQFGAGGYISLCRQGPLPRRTSLTSIITVSRPISLEQPWRYVHDRNISLLRYSYIPGESPSGHHFSNSSGKSLLELQAGNSGFHQMILLNLLM